MQTRRCNECGEQWPDDGSYECPYCESDETEIVEVEEMRKVRLTERRAQIIVQVIIPFLEANKEAGDNDLWVTLDEERDEKDLQAAIDWIWQEAQRRLKERKAANV